MTTVSSDTIALAVCLTRKDRPTLGLLTRHPSPPLQHSCRNGCSKSSARPFTAQSVNGKQHQLLLNWAANCCKQFLNPHSSTWARLQTCLAVCNIELEPMEIQLNLAFTTPFASESATTHASGFKPPQFHARTRQDKI